jgi:hypothetical protein
VAGSEAAVAGSEAAVAGSEAAAAVDTSGVISGGGTGMGDV